MQPPETPAGLSCRRAGYSVTPRSKAIAAVVKARITSMTMTTVPVGTSSSIPTINTAHDFHRCCPPLILRMAASLVVSVWWDVKAPPGGCRAGFDLHGGGVVVTVSWWSSFGGDLGDRGAGGGFVDDAFVGGEGGDECGDREVVDGAGQSSGGLVDQGDGVVGEQGVGASG